MNSNENNNIVVDVDSINNDNNTENNVENNNNNVEFKKKSYSTRVCKKCGNMFIISDDAVIKSVKEFGTIPSRCVHCRKRAQRKYENKEAE